MFRYFIYNTYLRCNFHSRFHFGAVFVGPDGLMQPPFHIFTIVKHNVFLMTASSPFAFSPKEVLWPLRFPWYQKQVTKAMEKKKHRPQHRGKGKGKSPDKGNKKGPGKGKGKEKGKEARSSTPPPAVFAPPAQGKGKK